MTKRDSRIPLFSLETSLGTWLVSTDENTFSISQVTYGFPYYLTNDGFSDFELSTDRKLYELIVAVAQHSTGLLAWDECDESVSDHVRDWTPEYDDRQLINLVAEYLRLRPNGSMRCMVDYFEHKHSYFMNRTKIKELLVQLMLTGEIEKIPSMQMAPAEMRSLKRLAKKWLEPDCGPENAG